MIPALEGVDPPAVYAIDQSVLLRDPPRPTIGIEVLHPFRFSCPLIRRALNFSHQF